MTYCYARVSTEQQNLDRQLVSFIPFEPYLLYKDKMSGKNFDRPEYQKMRKKLKQDDILIISSIDRLGRNYNQIQQEFAFFKQKGVKIKVLDMPIIDTTTEDLTSKLISDIVIQLLGYVAQIEREKIRERQAQGVRIAKEKGVKFGRPRIDLPPHFIEVAKDYQKGRISNIQAYERLGVSRGTFFRLMKEYGYLRDKNVKPVKDKTKEIIKQFNQNKITLNQACRILDIKYSQFIKLLNGK